MYEGLPDLLSAAKSLSLITTLTTNGSLLTRERLASLASYVDLFAVSVDGVEASHNRIRGSSRAFGAMRRGLAFLRDAGRPFGLIFTLTMHNLHELEQVAAFAAEEGAALLQLHPLEETGRAQIELKRSAPDDTELAYAFLEVARLRRRHAGRGLKIQLDVADRSVLRVNPERAFAHDALSSELAAQLPLAHLVAPIVIEGDGAVVPLQYGFGRFYTIGDITRESLKDAAARWRQWAYEPFMALCRSVYDLHVAPGDQRFFNWYGAVTTASLLPNQVAARTGPSSTPD